MHEIKTCIICFVRQVYNMSIKSLNQVQSVSLMHKLKTCIPCLIRWVYIQYEYKVKKLTVVITNIHFPCIWLKSMHAHVIYFETSHWLTILNPFYKHVCYFEKRNSCDNCQIKLRVFVITCFRVRFAELRRCKQKGKSLVSKVHIRISSIAN